MSYFLAVSSSILSLLAIRKLKYANALRIELSTETLKFIFVIFSAKVSVDVDVAVDQANNVLTN